MVQNMKDLDLRDISIINAFPKYSCEKKVLTVGCGEGRIEYHLHKMGYDVLATDIKKIILFQEQPGLTFKKMNILDPDLSERRPIVICSETLEHLKDFQKAFQNLLDLTLTRLIVTFPLGKFFWHPSHKHFWSDMKGGGFRDVNEFRVLSAPYHVSISKIKTKPEDGIKKRIYLLVIDKKRKSTENV